jgi:DNA-binding transcriptional ArsR family regulator
MFTYVPTQVTREPSDAQVWLAVDMFKLLADSTRLRIIWALLHGEYSVNELAGHLGANPAGVSQHLAKLRLARLVSVRREANRAFYAAQDPHVRRLAEEALFHAGHVVGATADHDDESVAPGAPAEEESMSPLRRPAEGRGCHPCTW